MLLAPLAVLGLPGCFGKFTEYYRQRGQLNSFIGRISKISLFTTVLTSLAIVAYPSKFAYFLFRDESQSGLTICLGLALVVVTASNFLGTLMESLRQVRIVTIMRFITGITFAVVGTGLLLLWQDASVAATTGFAISCLAGSIPAIWILWKYRGDLKNTGEHLTQATMWKRIAPFAAWLWASNLLNNLIEVSDRYMLIHWSNTTAELAQGAVGQYHSGRVVPLLMVSVAVVLAGMLLPYMSEAWEAGDKKKAANQMNMALKLMSIVFTAGGLVTLLLAPFLFNVVFQGRYNDGLMVLPLTLVYCIFFSLIAIAQEYLWVSERGKWTALAIGLGLAINIVLNMMLIPMYGLHGAVLATTIGNGAILLILFAFNYKCGCRTDIGIWICGALPLLLTLGIPLASTAVAIVALIIIWTNKIMNAEEKALIIELVRSKFGKFLPAKFQ